MDQKKPEDILVPHSGAKPFESALQGILHNAQSGADIIGALGIQFVKDLRFYGTLPDATPRARRMWNIVEDYLGCAGREFNVQDHAKISVTFRSLLATSISLPSDFQHFSALAKSENWLVISIPQDVADTFSQMFLTEKELERKRDDEIPGTKTSTKLNNNQTSKPGKITHYANTKRMCCCSIQLASGENIMISIAAAPTPSVKIYKMGFWRMFPVKTIWEYNPTMAGGYGAYIEKMMIMFQDPRATEPKHPLDILRDRLLLCGSINDVRDSLIENELRARG